MKSVEIADLEKLNVKLKAVLDEVPEKRRELHENIASAIKSEVDMQIESSGLNDTSGRIKDWQESYIGSRGGYAAVRPTDSSSGKNSPGAITNYLEGGHAIRKPSGEDPNYRPRIRMAYVDGYHFYKSARNSVEAKAIAAVEDYVNAIADSLEE